MSLVGFGLASYLACAKIKPMTAQTEPRTMYCSQVKKDTYITKNFREDERIPVIVTFYENLHKSNAFGASGINLSRGGNFIATPEDIPFGTVLNLEGLGNYQVADRGEAIKWIYEGNTRYMKIDVFVEKYKYLDKRLFRLGKIYTTAKFKD